VFSGSVNRKATTDPSGGFVFQARPTAGSRGPFFTLVGDRDMVKDDLFFQVRHLRAGGCGTKDSASTHAIFAVRRIGVALASRLFAFSREAFLARFLPVAF
jgi:hypothetical protein